MLKLSPSWRHWLASDSTWKQLIQVTSSLSPPRHSFPRKIVWTIHNIKQRRCILKEYWWPTPIQWFLDKRNKNDVNKFNPLAKTYAKSPLKSAYRSNEKTKKRAYNQRIINVVHGTLTLLVFSSFGGCSFETERFMKRLNELCAVQFFAPPRAGVGIG